MDTIRFANIIVIAGFQNFRKQKLASNPSFLPLIDPRG